MGKFQPIQIKIKLHLSKGIVSRGHCHPIEPFDLKLWLENCGVSTTKPIRHNLRSVALDIAGDINTRSMVYKKHREIRIVVILILILTCGKARRSMDHNWLSVVVVV